MDINQLNEIIENSGLDKIGLRVMTNGETVSVGDYLNNSFTWDDGITTDEQLEGTCALDLEFDGWEVSEDRLNEMLALSEFYQSGDSKWQVVIVGGDESYEGNDDSEVVIYDAKCIAVLD